MQHWKQTGLNPTARKERGVVSFVASMLHHQNDTTPAITFYTPVLHHSKNDATSDTTL